MLNRLRLNTLLLFRVLQPDLLIPTLETSTRVPSNATNRYFVFHKMLLLNQLQKGMKLHLNNLRFIYVYISSVPYIYSTTYNSLEIDQLEAKNSEQISHFNF